MYRPAERRRLPRLPLLVLLAVLVVVPAAVLATVQPLAVDGDEPHYLIIAASVLRDFDFDVRNNYQHDAINGEIFPAPMQPHALMRTGGPQHMPGLGVILAIPFGLDGTAGARVSLVLLLTLTLGVAVYRWCCTVLDPINAMLATLGVLACSPVVFGSSQLYPDFAGGVAIFALASWLWRTGPRAHAGSWCVYWLFAGLLCWLHVKYYAPTAVLAAMGAGELWRHRVRFTPVMYATFAMLFLAGPALFATFSWTYFGDLLGGRGGEELNFDVARAIELVLGQHLDQVHGMFVSQPLLLSGLVALGWMIRRRHPLVLPWLLLYASVVVPNALQQIPYGGHVGPAGRFGWSALWLWLVPVGIAVRELRGWRSPYAVGLVLLAGIAYQAALAVSWIPAPQRLFNGLFAPDLWQPSLFPVPIMLSLPKLGPHGNIGYAPNVVWACAALALVAAGWLRRWRWRCLPALATAIAALFLLPVDDPLGRGTTSPLRRYEAEHMPRRCTAYPQQHASNGLVCRQDQEHAFAVAGPWVSLDPGAYEIEAAVRSEVPTAGVLEVVSSRGGHQIARRAFRMPGSRASFLTLSFHADRSLRDVEFRVRGRQGFEIDYIDLRRVGDARQAGRGGLLDGPGDVGGACHPAAPDPCGRFAARRAAPLIRSSMSPRAQ